MPLHRVDRLTGLILYLGGLIIPASGLAAPDKARATASVSARILVPISVSVTYTTSSRPGRVRVSSPNQQVFQLHIGQHRQHSYQHSPGDYPHSITRRSLSLAENSPQAAPVTLYFN